MGRLQVVGGTEILDGDIRLGHLRHEVDVIFKVISRYKIERFVEIGVHEGGLVWLLLKKYPKLGYLGLDINTNFIRPCVRERIIRCPNAILWERNCFDPNTIKDVLDWMAPSSCVIYCDNGNKPEEFRQYAPILRVGDIIMAHDYHDGRRIVKGVDGYGAIEFPKPEILESDVSFIRECCDELDKVDLSNTRIIGFIKR